MAWVVGAHVMGSVHRLDENLYSPNERMIYSQEVLPKKKKKKLMFTKKGKSDFTQHDKKEIIVQNLGMKI